MRVHAEGQATVETALVLPVVTLLLLVVVQAGTLMADRVTAVHAARAAARAVAVRPEPAEAERAVSELGLGDRVRVELTGDVRPGGLATVTVVLRPRALPVVGPVVSRLRITERLSARVEGG